MLKYLDKCLYIVSVSFLSFKDRCDEGPDMDPPDVTCSNISLPITEPNTFFGLTRGYNFTYTDVNPSLSNVTFNVTIGISGDLYPPGYTPVTMFAVDVCNNSASCLFHVENTRKYSLICMFSDVHACVNMCTCVHF